MAITVNCQLSTVNYQRLSIQHAILSTFNGFLVRIGLVFLYFFLFYHDIPSKMTTFVNNYGKRKTQPSDKQSKTSQKPINKQLSRVAECQCIR